MGKDPAFLFYPDDWLGGTMTFTLEEKGAYMQLLILQFNQWNFTEAQAKHLLSTCSPSVWDNIKHKFSKEAGGYYQKRLREEMDKRKKFTESRRNNALSPSKQKAYAKHMGNGDGNGNEDDNEDNIPPKKFIPPTLDEVKEYFKQEGYKEEIAIKAFKGYDVANWIDSKGKKIKSWKQKMIHVWFKEENKIQPQIDITKSRYKDL